MATTPAQVRDDIVEVTTAFAAALDAVDAALEAGTATAAQLGAVDSTLTGLQLDVRAIRADLDAADVTAYQLSDNAEVTLRLWAWERDCRHHLGRMEAGLATARDQAQELAAGQRRDLYVVKSGDTLQSIAAAKLGDWREWTRIADANGLEPGQPTAGTVLLLPPRR